MQHQEIGDEDHDQTWTLLPGNLIRSEGQSAIKDHNANEAYDNCATVLSFYKQIFNYHSVDNKNLGVVSSVHYRNKFQNAAWYNVPEYGINQMVYGDGGGSLYNFTACLDVIGHEMTHAVTQYNSMLEYEGEAGALNEHISDVFGIMAKQWKEQTHAKDSNWLLGEGCLMPSVHGVALRNMKNPGTAYKSGSLGTDPQPAVYSGVAVYTKANPARTARDHGGVHVFSGIPNRAFVLCAEAFGGFAWEKAGKIWWKVVTTPGRIPTTCTFLQFADETVRVAEELYGTDAAKTVRGAWNTVEVKRSI